MDKKDVFREKLKNGNDLNIMKAEMVRWDDIKDDFKDFDETSRNEIKRLLDMLLWKKGG